MEASALDIFAHKRIMLVGNNGSGKSYVAKELAAITGLPLVHLDMEFWRPGWQVPPEEEWAQKQRVLVAGESWIIDGNHTSTMEIRFAAAELVLFLDINRLVCLCGICTRMYKPYRDIPAYLERRFDRGFLRLCKGLWLFPKTRKTAILRLHRKYPDTPFYVVGSRRQMKKLLREWANSKTSL